MGVMGHYYSGMLDIYSDLTLQSTVFGTHVEIWRSMSSRRCGARLRVRRLQRVLR